MGNRQRNRKCHAEDESAPVVAVVGDICGGRQGRYVIAYPRIYEGTNLTPETSIMLLLRDWTGAREPSKQQMVTLTGVLMFEKGWRAASGSPIHARSGNQATGITS